MSDSLEYLSFAEPAMGSSSRQFLTQSYQQFPSDGDDRFYTPGQSTRIDLSGLSQNSFVLPRTMKLVYHAVSNTQTLPTDPGYAANTTVSVDGVAGLRNLPGCPFYGAPHIGSIQSEIPSLSSNLSAMQQDVQSQSWYLQRLMCSGDEGGCVVPGYKPSFGQKGRAWAAGGRDIQTRCDGVTGSFWRSVVDATNTPVVVRDFHLGGMQRFDVPASAWLDVADGCSSALPLAYLTSSSSNLLLRINWAPVSSAVVTTNKLHAADLVTYVVGGVSLQWTAINIIDRDILSSIQSLFRGEVSLPIAEGITVPVPMTLSHRAFRFASSTLPAPAGSFSIRVPAGQACCNAVMLKISGTYATDFSQGLNTADFGLVSPKAIIQNLVLRIGSARFPAREISDVYTTTPGGIDAKWALITTNPADANNNVVGGATYIATSDTVAAESYKQGRQFFSLFDNDSYDASPASELFDGTRGPSGASAKFAERSVTAATAPGGFRSVSKYCLAPSPALFGHDGVGEDGAAQVSPNVFIFNLQSLLPEMSLRERGYAISGVDIRNQADVIIEGRILGTAPPGVNLKATGGVLTFPECTQWKLEAAMSFTEYATLLPSRVDISAASGMIPSAAGSVASGGTM